MSYRPNVDAASWFGAELWPLIRRELMGTAACSLSAAIRRRRCSDWPQTRVSWSQVPSTTSGPTMLGRDLFIVPMRFGGGARLKILQAMAMEIPVLSTTLGCEGIDLPAEAIRLADDGERFAAAALDLLRDESGRRELARAGRAAVVHRYDWSSVAGPAVDALAALANRHKPLVPPKE